MHTTPETITVNVTINAPVQKVWRLWTSPGDIMQWNNPNADWHNLLVEVDLKNEGRFLFKMQAKNGSDGFDYCGKYDEVITHKRIALTTDDGRKTVNTFTQNGNQTTVTETFQPDVNTPVDLQKDFCQGVLNNFKRYAESA